MPVIMRSLFLISTQ